MSNESLVNAEKQARVLRQNNEVTPEDKVLDTNSPAQAALVGLQQTVGNRAVQRMLGTRTPGVQRDSGGSQGGEFTLDDEVAGKINSQRGGGQQLDTGVQRQMGATLGHDFSDVKVHTSNDAHELNEQVSSVAFTTGNDIFFRDGAYNPGSSSGQELLAHELTHVVQQSTGAVSGGGGGMTVNAPNDSFEQEADAVAKTAAGQPAPVQRQEEEEDETLQQKRMQRQEQEEDELLQGKRLQREGPEEDELLQGKRLQREGPEEDELLQGKRLQRDALEDEDEMAQAKRLQRQEAEEDEMIA